MPSTPTLPAPRVCIYGAGHIGCHLGARLACAGQAVTLVGRKRVLAELRADGLAYSDWRGAGGRAEPGAYTLAAEPAAAAGCGLVLVCVKSGSTAQAAAELAPLLAPGTVVLSLQNGLRNAELLRRHLPQAVVLPGMVPFNVVPRGQGVYHQATEGLLDAQAHASLQPWATVFERAGLPLRLHEDMAAVQWGKLLLNLANPINALCGLPLLQMLRERRLRRCMALVQREALALMRAAGIAPQRMTPLPPRWLPVLLELPDALFLRLAQRMLAVDPHARSSMADDLDKGRVSEVDHLNGEIVALAQRLGRRAPVNERLVALMHAAEREAAAGRLRPWSGEALWAELAAQAKAPGAMSTP